MEIGTKYDVYMLGAVSGEDGPKTRDLRAALGDLIVARGHNLLSPHVAYDYEQTTFRERIGGLGRICRENEALMDQANLFVAEASGVSEGRGYEVCYGLKVREVPVLLFREKSWGMGSSMVFRNPHELLYLAIYEADTLEGKFDHAIGLIPQMQADYQAMKKILAKGN